MDMSRSEIINALVKRTIIKIERDGEYFIFTLDDRTTFQCHGNFMFDTNGSFFNTEKVAEVQY